MGMHLLGGNRAASQSGVAYSESICPWFDAGFGV